MNDVIAHVRQNEDGSWASPHLLIDHLLGTAKKAEGFASAFNSSEWGKAIGLAHDAGKGREIWQNYLRRKSGWFDEEAHLEGKLGKIPHAIYGAELVEQFYGKEIGRFLSYGIAGHHAGLPDWSGSEGAGKATLQYQKSQVKDADTIYTEITNLIYKSRPTLPPWKFFRGLDLSLWIRMLYSCLVDADFLDTESYMSHDQLQLRGGYLEIEELLKRFNSHMERLDRETTDSRVNSIRRKVREKCIEMAKEPQGIFSLTVPTGGGKTLSSLAFALEHAKKYHLQRIIYVIPYTSIIEQTADVFRSALGGDQVVEHHSNVSQEDDSPKTRLSSENWDAPVIVTTSVQFFESLFSAKSSRCRKLHNIGCSVVVLDEAQLIPTEFLNPILETIQLLTEHYRTSFVISTATQPAFQSRISEGVHMKGLDNIREIMGNQEEVNELYQNMIRNQVEFPVDLYHPLSLEELSVRLSKNKQVLCVVSDRKSCLELYQLMPEGTYHLSSLMCGQHRSEVINKIKDKLKRNETVRVVSTQLVEAGVDLDFPVVYKSFAGLDSIAQAAGRCNREGKLPSGQVVVFILPRPIPNGILRKAADATRSMLIQNRDDLMDNGSFYNYFNRLYFSVNSLDQNNIIEYLSPDSQECGIFFRTASEKFKLIDDSNQKIILVRYKGGEKWINQLHEQGPNRYLMRKIQRYTVTVYDSEFNSLLHRRAIEEVVPGIFALSSSLDYSKQTGLHIDQPQYDPEQFIQ